MGNEEVDVESTGGSILALVKAIINFITFLIKHFKGNVEVMANIQSGLEELHTFTENTLNAMKADQ